MVLHDGHFSFNVISTDIMYKKLAKVKTNKAYGYDMIPPKIVKLSAPVLCNTLVLVFNNAVLYNVFPNDF